MSEARTHESHGDEAHTRAERAGGDRPRATRADDVRPDESRASEVRAHEGRGHEARSNESRPSVRVHIERLVLDGLPVTRAQGEQVGAAVEAELARLLADGRLGPVLLAGGALPAIPAGTLRLDGETRPARLGLKIARAIHEGLSR